MISILLRNKYPVETLLVQSRAAAQDPPPVEEITAGEAARRTRSLRRDLKTLLLIFAEG